MNDLIQERHKRFNLLSQKMKMQLKKIQLQALDLEEACQQGLTLKELFPQCEKPLFLIEGVSYFLSPECVEWLMKEILSYNDAAIIIDYWPEDGVHCSKIFSNLVSSLQDFMRESIVSYVKKGFWDNMVRTLKDNFFHQKFILLKR